MAGDASVLPAARIRLDLSTSRRFIAKLPQEKGQRQCDARSTPLVLEKRMRSSLRRLALERSVLVQHILIMDDRATPSVSGLFVALRVMGTDDPRNRLWEHSYCRIPTAHDRLDHRTPCPVSTPISPCCLRPPY